MKIKFSKTSTGTSRLVCDTRPFLILDKWLTFKNCGLISHLEIINSLSSVQLLKMFYEPMLGTRWSEQWQNSWKVMLFILKSKCRHITYLIGSADGDISNWWHVHGTVYQTSLANEKDDTNNEIRTQTSTTTDQKDNVRLISCIEYLYMVWAVLAHCS